MEEKLPVRRRWAVAALLLLTTSTGVVDAISLLRLGHVFVANMTGNVVFLALSLAPASGFTVLGNVVAILAFLLGAVLGGRIGLLLDARPRRWFVMVFSAQTLVLALLTVLTGLGVLGDQHVLIGVLALCFGLQSATVNRLAPRDLTTTVLTRTLVGLAADSVLGGRAGSDPYRRLASVLFLFIGAAIGALLLGVTFSGVFALATLLVAAATVIFAFAPPDQSLPGPLTAGDSPGGKVNDVGTDAAEE